MTIYLTTTQLAALVGRKPRTIRHHVANGWLKAEPKKGGVRGSMFSYANARKWASRHFGKQI